MKRPPGIFVLSKSEQRVVLFTAFMDKRLNTKATGIGVRACLSKNDLRRLPAVIGGLG